MCDELMRVYFLWFIFILLYCLYLFIVCIFELLILFICLSLFVSSTFKFVLIYF